MKKKFISVILVIIMIIAALPLAIFAGGGQNATFTVRYFLPVESSTQKVLIDGKTIHLPDSKTMPQKNVDFTFEAPNGKSLVYSVNDSSFSDDFASSDNGSYSLDSDANAKYVVWTYKLGEAPEVAANGNGTYIMKGFPAFDGFSVENMSWMVNSLGRLGSGNFVISDAPVNEIVITIYLNRNSNLTATPFEAKQQIKPSVQQPQNAIIAKQTTSAILINDQSVEFDAYNIGGNNYFKLRDLAYALNESEKQFDVTWDNDNKAISIINGDPYTIVGNEMTIKVGEDKTPIASTSKIYLDENEVTFTAYNINGNNYFKLRDIAKALDFEVNWDNETNTITIDTDKGYTSN